MNKFEYMMTMVKIEKVKYKKNIEAIVRELHTKIGSHVLSIVKPICLQRNIKYEKKISVKEFILLSKCFLRIMNKAYEKDVRLPKYIHDTYERARQWLSIVLFQINATYEQILEAYEFESDLYLTDYHHEYIQYFIDAIGTNKPHFNIKIIKFEVYPLISKLYLINDCFQWNNDIVPLAVNYLKFYFKNKQSVVIDAIEQYLKKTFTNVEDKKKNTEQINKVHNELICILKAYEETFKQQINIKLKDE